MVAKHHRQGVLIEALSRVVEEEVANVRYVPAGKVVCAGFRLLSERKFIDTRCADKDS